VLVLLLAGCTNELVVLLPEADGSVGVVEVNGQFGQVTLDSAYQGATGGDLRRVSPVAFGETEVQAQFSDALAAQPTAPVSYVLYFEEGTTTVVPASRPAMAALVADVRARDTVDVQVTGHTDRVGSVEDNDILARERAAMVRAVLIRESGFSGDAVRAVGRGEREPLIPTPDGVREPRNRRVQVIVR
jgi:outer membrane protein OmpA-like peptidoglycan-associated protein